MKRQCSFVLADTDRLHAKITDMSDRIRQLEDALEISHSSNSSHNHPLLREELLSIKRGVAPSNTAPEVEADGPEGDYVEAMGTMSISQRGVSRFIGRTGGSESLFLVRLFSTLQGSIRKGLTLVFYS